MLNALNAHVSRLYQSRLAYIASFLILTLQRSPVVTHLAKLKEILGQPLVHVARLGAPVAAYFGGTHAVTGATGVVPAGGSVNPAEAVVGENFVWVFRATGSGVMAHSYTVRGLPAGLEKSSQVLNGGVSSFSGVPEEAGTFTVEIIAWRRENERGTRTPTYELTLNVVPGDPPTIAAQPEGGAFDVGTDAKLEVSAEGHGLHYRWMRNGKDIPSTVKPWIDETTERRVLVPTENPGSNWRSDLDFDHSGWISGTGGIGYERSNDDTFKPFIGIDVESEAFNERTSTMVRIPFELSADDLHRLNDLRLRLQYDDGYIAFLNGTPVASANAPSPLFLTWNSKATDERDDVAAIEFTEIDLSEHAKSLNVGANLLAFQALNESANSSAFLLNVELLGGRNVDRPTLELADLTSEDAGDYAVEVFNSSGTALSETVKVEINGSGATGYAAWIERHWPNTPAIEATGGAYDPDGDDLVNLLEYYYDSDPLKPADALQPRVTAEGQDAGRRLVLRFPRGRVTDYTSSFEISGSMDDDSWQPLQDGVDEVEITATETEDVIRLPARAAKHFIRMRLVPNE